MAKKKLSQQQEFEIMKLVLDKILWLGFILAGYGLYVSFTDTLASGLTWIIVGIVVLLLFSFIIVKEYEFIK